jgi:uncharacterized repeat protein (TIGR01451 family)
MPRNFFEFNIKTLRQLCQQCLVAVLLGVAAPAVFALGTPAGTLIPNVATLTYTPTAGQPPVSVAAAAPNIAVAEVINVVLTSADGSLVTAGSPDTGKVLTFLLTNTGNGPESYRLERNNLIAGDQFDPSNVAGGAIYIENGAQAGFQASGPNADIAYVPGVNDPLLAADASRTLYVLSNIPTGQTNGAIGNVSLTASATTAGAAGARPGTALAGLGQSGVDAVVGGSRAQSVATGGYVISGLLLNMVKSVINVRDPAGGILILPGTVLTYRIVLTLTGVGIAENLIATDPLPTSTTYVPGSTTVDGVARTDAADADNASFAAGTVSVVFGNTTSPATRVLELRVTVN